jgi:protein TonB
MLTAAQNFPDAFDVRHTARRWAGSFSLALVLHALLLASLLTQSITFGAKAPGVGGIEVSLAPMGAGGGAGAAKPAGAPEPVAAPSPPPVPQAKIEDEPEPVKPDDIVQEVAKPKPKPVVVEPPRPAKKVAEPKPLPKKETTAKATDTKLDGASSGTDDKSDSRSASANAGAGDKGKGTQATGSENANGLGGLGGGVPGATPSYLAQLQAWLEKHKEFPRAAQIRRQQGMAKLFFVIDRDGKVLDFRIEKSSGHDLLDKEVLAMIRRASPVPPMPSDMTGPRLEVVVPVQFFLR